jgi:hypothetical protein
MKTTHFTLVALLGSFAVLGVRAADTKTSPRVEVTFVEPEKFTDIADGPRGSDFGREGNVEELKTYLVERANRYVPAGQKLLITVTDVDLAGEIEPWRSGSAHDVRIVKDIYRPRIELSYKLVDASGATIKEGKRSLTDMTFNMNINPNRSDPRVYEKRLLDDWLRSDFPKPKK